MEKLNVREHLSLKIPLHKDKSYNIIPIAIYNYFVKKIPIEDTIYKHRNIFDFCAAVRAKKSDKKGIIVVRTTLY